MNRVITDGADIETDNIFPFFKSVDNNYLSNSKIKRYPLPTTINFFTHCSLSSES